MSMYTVFKIQENKEEMITGWASTKAELGFGIS
jgi:hypothetical protein